MQNKPQQLQGQPRSVQRISYIEPVPNPPESIPVEESQLTDPVTGRTNYP